MHFNWKLFLGVFLILENIVGILCNNIREITSTNIIKIQEDKPFLILYMTAQDCLRCGLILPKFMAASQSFKGSTDIVFGKVSDSKLSNRLNITRFPTIVYYSYGTTEPKIYKGEITVDTIIDLIVDKNYGDFSSLERHYTVDIDEEYFLQVTMQLSQCKMLLIYDEKSNKEVELIEEVAAIFKNDDDITLIRFDGKKETKLASHFAAQTYPALYWFDKVPRKNNMFYGGRFHKLEMSTFIMDKTGIDRQIDGSLAKTAGTVVEIEEVIEQTADDINEAQNMDEVISEVKDIAKKYDKKDKHKLAHYYVHLLNDIKMAESTTTLTDEKYDILELRAKSIGPKSADLLKKRQNVIDSIIDIVGYPLSVGKQDSKMAMMHERLPIELHNEFDEDFEKMVKQIHNQDKKKKSKKAKKKHMHDEL